VLASRRRDFENAAEFRSPDFAGINRSAARRAQPNMIELGFIVCRISRHLSANIACPLLMDNENSGTSQRPRPVLELQAVSKPYQNPIF